MERMGVRSIPLLNSRTEAFGDVNKRQIAVLPHGYGLVIAGKNLQVCEGSLFPINGAQEQGNDICQAILMTL